MRGMSNGISPYERLVEYVEQQLSGEAQELQERVVKLMLINDADVDSPSLELTLQLVLTQAAMRETRETVQEAQQQWDSQQQQFLESFGQWVKEEGQFTEQLVQVLEQWLERWEVVIHAHQYAIEQSIRLELPAQIKKVSAQMGVEGVGSEGGAKAQGTSACQRPQGGASLAQMMGLMVVGALLLGSGMVIERLVNQNYSVQLHRQALEEFMNKK